MAFYEYNNIYLLNCSSTCSKESTVDVNPVSLEQVSSSRGPVTSVRFKNDLKSLFYKLLDIRIKHSLYLLFFYG